MTSGLEGLKSQILTMSLMKGDSTYNMIYSFLIVTLVEYIFAFIPLIKMFIESKINEYFKKATVSIATLTDKPREKTASINFSRIYDKGENTQDNKVVSNTYETADCLLEIMTQLDSCKHVVCDTFFYVNHHETIEISPKVMMQVTKIEKGTKGGLQTISFELFSYEYTLTELQDYITKVIKASRIKRQNKLGNQLYYFNEIVESLPKSNGKIMYSRANPTIGFSMTPFFTNKNLYNMYGENFQVVSKRVNFFINNEDWYKKKGIPYTLGILIHGPPGSGKTSCIKAIANSTKRHIVNISLTENTTKTQLQNLFYNNELVINKTNVQERLTIPCDKRVYVIEDIDCLTDVVLDRKFKKEEKKITIKNGNQIEEIEQSSLSEDADEKINLSFLLNLFDGVLETPGRILIMSSNYPERIDKALIRPGRVDLNIEFGYCSKETIKDIIHFIYEIPLDELQEYEFADNVYTPAKVNQLLFNNINDKQKGIDSLLHCNYVSKIDTPVDTPRDKIISCVEDVFESEVKEELKEEIKYKEEVPKGTTSLDDMFGDDIDGKEKFLKRVEANKVLTSKNEQRLSFEEQIATDEEVLRIYTKIKKAYDKGLAKELFEESSIEDVIKQVDYYIKHKKLREGHSIGMLKKLEKSLDENNKKYGIVLDEDNISSLIKERYPITQVFNNQDSEGVDHSQARRPPLDDHYIIADDNEVIRVLTKQKNALEKGLGEKIYRDQGQITGTLLNIDIALNDKKRRKDYSVNRIKVIEKELDEQIKEYGIVLEPEEINLEDVLSKLTVAFNNKDVETINSLQKYVPTDYTHWRVANSFSVINFLEKKRKALKKGLASHLYDNEYQKDAAYFDIQNKLNDNIGLNMYMEKTFKQMEKELDEQIKKYNIVVD